MMDAMTNSLRGNMKQNVGRLVIFFSFFMAAMPVVGGSSLGHAPITHLLQSAPAPSPGQVLVTSMPSGLNVYVERHKEPPKQNLTRVGNIEEKPDGPLDISANLNIAGQFMGAFGENFTPEGRRPGATKGVISYTESFKNLRGTTGAIFTISLGAKDGRKSDKLQVMF